MRTHFSYNKVMVSTGMLLLILRVSAIFDRKTFLVVSVWLYRIKCFAIGHIMHHIKRVSSMYTIKDEMILFNMDILAGCSRYQLV